MKVKLKFLEFMSNKLNKFLRWYQADQPLLSFLCNSLKEILTSLFQMLILNDTIRKLQSLKLQISSKVFLRVWIHSKTRTWHDKNMQPLKKADTTLTLMNWHKWFESAQTLWLDSDRCCCKVACCQLQEEVCMLHGSLTSHFMEKSPWKHLTVRCLSCSNTTVFTTDTNKHEVSKKQFTKVMEKSVGSGRLNQRRKTELRTSMKKCWRN